jgi:hypothetical protein
MRWIAAIVVLGWFAGATLPAFAAPEACASTPGAALLAARGSANALAPAPAHGYRVESVRWDPLLRQNWAVIGSCDHPGWPSMTRWIDLPAPPTRISTPSYADAVPTVRAGDVVHLWKREHDAHIEMIAVAEENGAVGARVRLRLAKLRDADGEIARPQYLAGVVRGPADVELEP